MAAGPAGPGTSGVPGPRNRYADLLRVLAICLVVLGHWLLTSVSYRGGRLSGASAMAAVGWSGWATLLFQVMPVFFLVGGYANALSWTRHRAGGATWAQWVQHRAIRLLRPTTVFVAAVVTPSRPAACWARTRRSWRWPPGGWPSSSGSCPSTCC